MKSVLLRRLRSSGAYGVVVESDAISDALATRAGIAIKPWKYATTLFTDTAGTVAASAAGDIIAGAKDDSRGLTLGPELVVNGAVDTDTTGWTAQGDAVLSVDTNRLKVEVGASGAAAIIGYEEIAVVVGKTYLFTGAATQGTSAATIRVGTAVNAATYGTVNNNTTGTFFFTATTTSLFISCRNGTATAGLNSFYDNISLKEAPAQYQQTTLANRPILTRWPKAGKRNLFLRTQDFDNAYWTKSGATISANTTTAPDGTTTADTLIESATTAAHYTVCLNATSGLVTGALSSTATFTVYAKAASGTRYLQVYPKSAPTGSAFARFNLQDGTSAVSGTGASASATSVGDGWYRCVLTYTVASAGLAIDFYYGLADDFADAAGTSYAGDGTSGIYIWGAQLETGSSATDYQKVTNAYDITETGQADCWGLTFDGTNDGMATAATLNLSGSDKVGVFAGVTRNAYGASQMILEHSVNSEVNNGAYYLCASPGGGAAIIGALSRGSANSTVVSTGASDVPSKNVYTITASISTDELAIRNNGSALISSASDQGTGNYGNYTNYIGARAGSSVFFNGIIWGAAIVSTLTTADVDVINDIEAQIADNTPGVTL